MMKKSFPRLQRLSRPQLIIGGIFVAAVLGGGSLWLYDNQQKSDISKAQLAEVNRLIDQQLSDQIIGGGQSEIAAGTQSQSETTPNQAPVTSNKSSSPSTATSSTSAPSSSTGGQQTTPQQTAPKAADSPTSPSYPNDNGDTPQITLTNPSQWKQVVSGSFTATATASDSSGVNRVVFMLRKIGQAAPVQMVTDTEAPYSAVIHVGGLPNGDSDYTVEAQVFDNTAKGNMASYRINIQN